jgi:hypothetical protein
MRYAWGALMVNQFTGELGDPVWLDGETVLEHYQLKNYHDRSSAHYSWYTPTVEMWANIGFLVLFFAVFFVFAWMTLKYKTFNAR